jgi:hypothetical protein
MYPISLSLDCLLSGGRARKNLESHEHVMKYDDLRPRPHEIFAPWSLRFTLPGSPQILHGIVGLKFSFLLTVPIRSQPLRGFAVELRRREAENQAYG